MKNSIFCVIFNIVFNLLLIRYLKVSGLALASSMSAILAVFFLMINLRRKIGKFNVKSMIVTFIKTSLSALAMAVVVLKLFALLSPVNEILALIVSIGSGAIIYGVMVLVLKVDSTKYVINRIRRR